VIWICILTDFFSYFDHRSNDGAWPNNKRGWAGGGDKLLILALNLGDILNRHAVHPARDLSARH
jgi:hypothetical protein